MEMTRVTKSWARSFPSKERSGVAVCDSRQEILGAISHVFAGPRLIFMVYNYYHRFDLKSYSLITDRSGAESVQCDGFPEYISITANNYSE